MNTKEQAAAISKQVGANLRQMRIARGWTQQKLGDSLGIVHQQVHRYETGKARLSAPTMLEICKLFGARPYDFFIGCDYGGEPEAPLDAYIMPKSETMLVGLLDGHNIYAIRESKVTEA